MISKVFKSHIPAINYFFKNGKQAAFMLGKYVTHVEHEIIELTEVCATNSPHFYIDPTDCEIDSEALTPMEIIRQEAYAQAKADLLASGAMSDIVSESNNGNQALSFATTANIAEASAAMTGVKLASLTKGK